jgi:hypothetical protein
MRTNVPREKELSEPSKRTEEKAASEMDGGFFFCIKKEVPGGRFGSTPFGGPPRIWDARL